MLSTFPSIFSQVHFSKYCFQKYNFLSKMSLVLYGFPSTTFLNKIKSQYTLVLFNFPSTISSVQIPKRLHFRWYNFPDSNIKYKYVSTISTYNFVCTISLVQYFQSNILQYSSIFQVQFPEHAVSLVQFLRFKSKVQFRQYNFLGTTSLVRFPKFNFFITISHLTL